MPQIVFEDTLPASKVATEEFYTPYVSWTDPKTGTVYERAERTYSVSAGSERPARKFIQKTVTSNRGPTIDKDSFAKIKQSGLIKMSPYFNSTITDEYFPVKSQDIAAIAIHPGLGLDLDNNGSYETIPYDWGFRVLTARSDFSGILSDFTSDRPVYSLSSFDQKQIDQTIEDLKSRVVAETISSYDLLTELAELKSTLELARNLLQTALNPLSSFANWLHYFNRSGGKKFLSERKKAEAITSKWMEYRYGIMPIIYSINDIVKLVSQLDNVYRTVRQGRSIDVSDSSEAKVGSSKGVFDTVSGSVRIHCMSKTRFDLGQLARLIDQTSLNIFRTAWELVPFSFVVDWFANVGDWLLAHTSLATPGVSTSYCYSIKKEIVHDTFVRLWANDYEVCTSNAIWGTQCGQVSGFKNTVLARRQTIQEYHRMTFTQADINFYVSGPYMSWKRWVDAFSLSLTQLNRAFRRLA